MKWRQSARLFGAALSAASSHPGPVLNAQPNKVGGTIAGIVKTTDAAIAVPGRKVSVDRCQNRRATRNDDGANGGYTIQVPEGTYRFELELREGETLAKQPDHTHVSNSDLDATRDFVITTRAGGTP